MQNLMITSRFPFFAFVVLVLSAAVLAGCGDSKSKSAKKASAKPVKIAKADLSAAVGTPQGNASFVANMVAQCLEAVDRKKPTAPADGDCTDPDAVAKFNPTYAETLQTGNKPGGTVVTSAIDSANFSVTAQSEDVKGVGVTSWTYYRDSSGGNYKSHCSPAIVKYCEDDKITPYYG